MSDATPILLVDLSAIYWASFHSSANDELSAARDRTLAQIRKLAGAYAHVAICCDAPDGNNFRKNIYADYKANRPAKDQAALDELRQTRERLAADGFTLWSPEGYEADDVIASACEEAKRRGVPVVIATADKDLMQLVDDEAGICIVSTRTGDIINQTAVFEKFGVPPTRVRDWLALVGDNSDNVPGVPKIGAKTAAQLITTYGSLEKVYEAVETAEEPITNGVRSSLKEHVASARISRELVTLRTDAPISFDDVFKERETKPLPVREHEEKADPEEETTNDEHVQSAAPEPTEKTVTALVAHPVTYEQELQPRSMNQAWTLAKGLYQSRLYSKFPNPESIWAIIQRGREMGLGALTALDCFHVIEGKPSLYAYLIIARAKAHPDCEYFQCIETTPERSTWETKNRNNPRPTKLTYTFDQAKVAQLPKMGSKGPNGWLKNPDDMVRKAAGVKLARMEYPEAALGLYSVEELSGETSE